MTSGTSNTSDTITRLKALSKNEPVAKLLGMKLTSLVPGRAKVSMTLKAEHLNFKGGVFGGVIASLADYAFSYGSNSANYPSIAAQFNINFIAAPSVGDKLTAECRVIRSGRRAGISEITVKDQAGKLIARATGITVPVGK
ncbi:MAG TPA: PaaI family thioesterase [Dehalococcoidales bacterium]|nr:PaaI family thioesterase [Dehalococcoidales bacterium]